MIVGLLSLILTSFEMPRCYTCRVVLQDDGNSISCSECESYYHGAVCSGMTEAAFAGKREATKKTWKCDACRSGNALGSAGELKGDEDLKTMVIELNRKIACLLPLNEKVDGIETSIKVMSDHFDTFLARLNAQDKEIKDIRGRVDKLEKEGNAKVLRELKQAVNDLEWRNRRLNLVVHGVAETKDEDLLSKLNEVAKKIDMEELAPTDVVALHRLNARPGKERGVIVRFARQKLRDAWLEKRKVLRERQEPISFTENMTNHARTLLTYTKAWAQEAGYAFAWHSNGKVLIRKKTGDPPIVVTSEADLSALSD